MQFITTSSITVSAVPVEPDADWHDHANCLGVDPDLFFPERGASTREAKEVCRGCVVRHDCLEFALQNGEKFGIWGGLSERERRRIRRQRAQVARSTSVRDRRIVQTLVMGPRRATVAARCWDRLDSCLDPVR